MTASYALIADPDVVAAHVYLSALREVGLGTVLARDGSVAVSAIRDRGAPALLVTELALPGLDGLELVEGLRRSTPEQRTPVIVVSSDRDLRDRADALRTRLGIGAILARAASEESVKRVIRRLLGVSDDAARPAKETAPPPARSMELRRS